MKIKISALTIASLTTRALIKVVIVKPIITLVAQAIKILLTGNTSNTHYKNIKNQ